MLPESTYYYSSVSESVSVVTLIYTSLSVLRQTDVKALVAMSSVSHMSLTVMGVYSLSETGTSGTMLLALSHGVVSPGLFILVGGVLYDRFHTRSLRAYRGLTLYMPLASSMLLLFSLCNMAAPLSGNWIGELLVMMSVYSKSAFVAVLSASSVLLSACYSTWMHNRLSLGSWSAYLDVPSDLSRRELWALASLQATALLLGILPNLAIH